MALDALFLVEGMVSLLLSPKVWIALAFAAMLAFCGVQQVRVNNAQTEIAKIKAEYAEERQKAAEAARLAEKEAREEEQRREQRKQEIIDEAEGRTEIARAAADDAKRTADRLRQRLDAFADAIRGATKDPGAPGSSQGKQDSEALDMLVSVLNRASDRAGELAAYADRLHVAGQACEQAFDGLRR